MRGKKAKLLRKAAGQNETGPQQYEQPKLHRIVHFPAYETHVLRRRSYALFFGGYIITDIEKIRYLADGKTPAKPLMRPEKDAKTGEVSEVQQTYPVPISKPTKLLKGSDRQAYHFLKRLERRVGIEAMFEQLLKDTTQAAA